MGSTKLHSAGKLDAAGDYGGVFDFGDTGYLAGAKAVISTLYSDHKKDAASGKVNMLAESDNFTVDADDLLNVKISRDMIATNGGTAPKGMPADVKFVSWGDNNSLPVDMMKKVYKNVGVATNIEFNAQMVYGEDFLVVKRQRKATSNRQPSADNAGKIDFVEQLPSEQSVIFDFLEMNNVNKIRQEIGNDIALYARSFVELILNKKRDVVMMRHLEACYSRVSEMNPKTGKIEWHGYSALWHKGGQPKDLTVSPLIDSEFPIRDFLMRIGKLPRQDGKMHDDGEMRYVLDISTPTPGRFYYQKPWWWSIFESGWNEFARAIPEFKKALMRNSMVLRYHVQIQRGFWEKQYKAAGITDVKKQKDWKTGFLKKMNDFLGGSENAGKSFVSEFEYDRVNKGDLQDIKIVPIETNLKGGEYIEDSEEASNIICNAMGVHPSLVGAAPGKSKNVNGTEARELFIIKQARCKPARDMILLPLQLVQRANGWDKDIQFRIANLMLTTLDNGTGSVKVTGDQKVN